MKHTFNASKVRYIGIIALVAVLGFSITACGDDSGGGDPPPVKIPGSLTINDIPDPLVGSMYIAAIGAEVSGGNVIATFAACKSMTRATFEAKKITGSTVSLNLFIEEGSAQPAGKIFKTLIFILDHANISESNSELLGELLGEMINGGSPLKPQWISSWYYGNVPFGAGNIADVNIIPPSP